LNRLFQLLKKQLIPAFMVTEKYMYCLLKNPYEYVQGNEVKMLCDIAPKDQ